MNQRIAAALVLFVAVLTAGTACSSSGTANAPSPVSTPASTAAQSAASSSADVKSPADLAIAQASAAVPRYLAMLDTLYSDSKVTTNDIYGVAVAPESTTEALAIAKFRSAGDRQTGKLKLVNISSPTADLSPGGATSNPKYPAVTLTACVDVAGTAATGRDGKPVDAPGRPPYLIEHLTLVNISYPSAMGWRVSNAPNKQADACGA